MTRKERGINNEIKTVITHVTIEVNFSKVKIKTSLFLFTSSELKNYIYLKNKIKFILHLQKH